MISFLQNTIQKQISLLQNNLNRLPLAKQIIIDKSFLNEEYKTPNSFNNSETHRELYNNLKTLKCPVLYWFELDKNKVDVDSIIADFKNFKENNKGRDSSAFPFTKDFSDRLKILYLGKVKKDFHLRLVNHLGYSTNPNTVGLQLAHWFDTGKYGNLTLNYITLNKEMEQLISVLEIELAKELKPLIGKHNN